MTNDKEANKLTQNKGIALTSTDVPSQKSTDDSSPHDISVKHVREDVKNVIERMGSESLKNKRNRETDTEDIESTTYDESIVQLEIKEITKNGNKGLFDTSQDISEITAYDVSELTECCPINETQKQCATSYPPKTNPKECNNISTSVAGSYPSSYVNQHEIYTRCPHVYQDPQTNGPLETKPVKQELPERSSRLANWLGIKNKKESACKCNRTCDLYTINIVQPTEDHSPPRRLVFDLLDELPKADTKTVATNTKKNKSILPKKKFQGIHQHVIKNPKGNNETQRVDIYYFDHGNSEYYRTTEPAPVIMTELLAERTEEYTKRFWAQIFGTIHIGVSFVISFILQLIRFLLQAIIRPLTIGFVQTISDNLIKPCLSVIFNGLVQPALIFFYNVATSVRDVCLPIADSIGYFLREFAVILKSIRLINVDNSRIVKTCKHCEEPRGK